MEEIDLKELFNFFKNKIGLFIIISMGTLVLGALYGLINQNPLYSSYTTVILAGTNETLTQNDITLNKDLVNTYAEIVKSRKVLNQVIEELNLDIKYETLSSKISVSSVNNTEIIKISVVDANSINAKNIANVTAKIFTKEVINYYNINNVEILDDAIAAENPYNINNTKQVIIYLMLGVMLGAGVIFVIFYFDRTIKSTEQIEEKIKLPILGSVQNFEKGGKRKWKKN